MRDLRDLLLPPDIYVLLCLFENHRGVNVTLDFDDMCQHYHSVYLEPKKRPKTSWSPTRVRRALADAVGAGYVAKKDPWMKWDITPAGIAAREWRRRAGHETR